MKDNFTKEAHNIRNVLSFELLFIHISWLHKNSLLIKVVWGLLIDERYSKYSCQGTTIPYFCYFSIIILEDVK